MSYEPTEWKTGDIVTAEKLNKMENGIEDAGGVLLVNAILDPQTNMHTLDKTWQQIYDSHACFIRTVYGENSVYWEIVREAYGSSMGYGVAVYGIQSDSYACSAPDQYPTQVTT